MAWIQLISSGVMVANFAARALPSILPGVLAFQLFGGVSCIVMATMSRRTTTRMQCVLVVAAMAVGASLAWWDFVYAVFQGGAPVLKSFVVVGAIAILLAGGKGLTVLIREGRDE